MSNVVNRCPACGVSWMEGEAPKHVIGCNGTPPTVAAALRIGRMMFGGIKPDGPQWSLCMALARAADPGAAQMPATDVTKTGVPAFAQCDAFNRANPRGTEGVIHTGFQPVATVLDGPAMVFPDQKYGERVMAWFRHCGWRDTTTFMRQDSAPKIDVELINLGLQAKGQNKMGLAQRLFDAALNENAANSFAWNEKGAYSGSQFRFSEALVSYNHALAISPDSGEIINNRSTVLRALGLLEEALRDAERAHELLPAQVTMALNRSLILDDMGRLDEALVVLNKWIDVYAGDSAARYNRALLLLGNGRLAEGWREFDWRLRQPAVNTHYEHYDILRWRGEPLEGKSILVWGEQGIGDEIMTSTMFKDVIDAANHVTVLCSDRLVPLFRRSFPAATIGVRPDAGLSHLFRRDQLSPAFMPEAVRLRHFDYQASQIDLGIWFRSNGFPADRGQSTLQSDVQMCHQFREMLEAAHPYKKLVGLSWHSRGNPNVGKIKSASLDDMLPILKSPGCVFLSLQYGDCADEIRAMETQHGITIHTVPGIDQMRDLDSFAAFVNALDLVITVSNTTAHMAGSLAVPCWMLTPTGPGRLWYWFKDRESSPWYPSMTLFRQERASDWSTPVMRVAAELAKIS